MHQNLEHQCGVCLVSVTPRSDAQSCLKCSLCGQQLMTTEGDEKNHYDQPCSDSGCVQSVPSAGQASNESDDEITEIVASIHEEVDYSEKLQSSISLASTACPLEEDDALIFEECVRTGYEVSEVPTDDDLVQLVKENELFLLQEARESEVQTPVMFLQMAQEAELLVNGVQIQDQPEQPNSMFAEITDKENEAASEPVNKICPVCQTLVSAPDILNISDLSYHVKCFACRKCKRLLSVPEFKTVEGVLYCDPKCPGTPKSLHQPSIDEFSPNELNTNCTVCGKRINNRDKLEAAGRACHRDCFKCSKCDRVLNIWKFKEENGSFYCDPYCPPKIVESKRSENTEEICCVCHKRVSINCRLLLSDKLYHIQCFTCSQCGRQLNAWKYKTEDGKCLCKPNCQTAQLIKQDKVIKEPNKICYCFVCQKPVRAEDRLDAVKRVYHTQCFRCHGCGRQLNLWKFRVEKDFPYCAPQCTNPKDITSTPTSLVHSRKCIICSNTVRANDHLEVLNDVCHTGCFKCYKCHKPLNIWKFKLDEGKMCCEPHCVQVVENVAATFTKSQKDQCQLCKQSLPMEHRVCVGAEAYHVNCFKCSKCTKLLNIWKYKLKNGKLVCEPRCSTLPSSPVQGQLRSSDHMQSISPASNCFTGGTSEVTENLAKIRAS